MYSNIKWPVNHFYKGISSDQFGAMLAIFFVARPSIESTQEDMRKWYKKILPATSHAVDEFFGAAGRQPKTMQPTSHRKAVQRTTRVVRTSYNIQNYIPVQYIHLPPPPPPLLLLLPPLVNSVTSLKKQRLRKKQLSSGQVFTADNRVLGWSSQVINVINLKKSLPKTIVLLVHEHTIATIQRKCYWEWDI